MEKQKITTSFIPRRESAPVRRSASSLKMNLITIIGIGVFVLSVILAASAFLYQKTLVKNLQLSNEKLLAIKGSLDPEFIAELLKLDRRLKSANNLLIEHQTVSPIFSLLENETLEKIRFQTFQYSVNTDGQIYISIEGEADSFNAIALQSDIFGSSPVIGDPIFKNFTINDTGNVNFDFSGLVDRNSFLYTKILEKESVSTTTDTNSDFTQPGLDETTDNLDNLEGELNSEPADVNNNGKNIDELFNDLPEF